MYEMTGKIRQKKEGQVLLKSELPILISGSKKR